MIRITYNGQHCDKCGHRVQQLCVGVDMVHDHRRYVGNVTLPCMCVHAIRLLPVEASASFERELVALMESP